MTKSPKNKSYNFLAAVTVACVCFVFVTGAFWNKDKRENSNSVSQEKTGDLPMPQKAAKQSSETAAKQSPETIKPAAAKTYSKAAKPLKTNLPIVPKPEKILTPTMIKPELQQEQINQVRAELMGIIERTRALEKQAQVDRIKVDQILTQARIHEQILKNMKPPALARTPDQVNVTKILDQEKLKLIAQRTEQNREELSKLEQLGVKKSETQAVSSRNKEF